MKKRVIFMLFLISNVALLTASVDVGFDNPDLPKLILSTPQETSGNLTTINNNYNLDNITGDLNMNLYKIFNMTQTNTTSIFNSFYSSPNETTRLRLSEGGYIDFDGKAEKVLIGKDLSKSATGTIMAWVMMDNVNQGFHDIINIKQGGDMTDLFQWRVSDGNGGAWSDGMINFISRNSTLATPNIYYCNRTRYDRFYNGIWKHITITSDGSTHKTYINGELATCTGSKALYEWWDDYTLLSQNWSTGYMLWNNVPFAPTDGRIDDLMAWNRSLSVNEVSALYRRGRNLNKDEYRDSGLLFHLRYDDLTDDTGQTIPIGVNVTIAGDINFIGEQKSYAKTSYEWLTSGVNNMTMDGTVWSIYRGSADYLGVINLFGLVPGGRVSSSLIPYSDKQNDLGSNTRRWKTIYYNTSVTGTPRAFLGDGLSYINNIGVKANTQIGEFAKVDHKTYGHCYIKEYINESQNMSLIYDVNVELNQTSRRNQYYMDFIDTDCIQQSLIEAIKELSAEINVLQARITELEKK